MFDEMQLKSAVKFSTQTGEPVGLENDCQDLKQVLHRLLAPDGEKQAPAKKVNQWLFVSFTPNGMDAWMGPFFFNDGNLTAATIANQFYFVVMGLESIGCELLGVSMDAGGCNARFAEEFFRELKKLRHESWLEDEDCYAVNFWGSLAQDKCLVLYNTPHEGLQECSARKSARGHKIFRRQERCSLRMGYHS